MSHPRRALLIAVLALIATTLALVPAPPASAAPSVLASDLTSGAAVNLLSFTDDPAIPFTSAGDGFQQFQRGVSPSIPFSILDDTLLSFPADTLGIIDDNDVAPFFGVTDTVNGDTTGPVSATWVFDITGGTDLGLSIDMGAMGDFEASDSIAWSYSIDAGPVTPAFSLVADEAGSRDYTLANGTTVITLDDPMDVGAVPLSNILQPVSTTLAGTGSQLTLSLVVTADGGAEAVAFRNIIITSEAGTAGPTPGDLVINEVMQNPAAVADGSGEWFEIQNVSTADIDIDGWTISDDGTDSVLISNDGPLVVPAGGFLVFGNNGDQASNGGAPVDYVYAGMFLSNSADELVLTDGNNIEFDRIEWDGGPVWPDPTGASMSLDPDFANSVDNDAGTNWCEGVSPFGLGDLGTPGAANTACEDPPIETVLIHQIQGSGANVAISGPVSVEAIVTSFLERDDVLDGFFIQEEDTDADSDPTTSEGLFVFCRGFCPDTSLGELAVGDQVTVIGDATDAFGMSQIDMRSGSVTVLSPPNPVPFPSASLLQLPAADSTLAELTFENLEGMVVTSPNTLVVSEYFQLARFGQVVLTDAARPYQFTHLNPPSPAGYDAYLTDLATRRIILDDDNNDNNDAISDGPDEPYFYPDGGLSISNKFRGGDTITGLTGVLHWSFAGSGGTDAWRVRPIEGVANTFVSANPAPFTPPVVGGTVTVASFNVLNYFASIDTGVSNCGPLANQGCRGADSAAELARQRDKIVSALAAMNADVVGLIELENDSDASIADLVAGLNAVLGAGTYDYIATGFIGADAIKVGYIYKPATVSPAGNFAVLDDSVDPTFVDAENRPVLIQTFDENATGERFTVAVNHLKSKGSDCDALGDPDLGDGQANCSQTRAAGALALANYLATDPTASGDPDFLIIGDLNAYAMEDAITTLMASGYTDLLNFFGGATPYSFVFDGQLGYLDHSLANSSLLSQVAGTAAWQINADEVNIFDYNDDIEDGGEASFERESAVLPVFAPDQFRSSDHDPVLIGLALNSIPENPECLGLAATIIGTAGADSITGTNGNDVIVTFGGNDIIDAGNGHDTICSGSGDDEISAGNGKDYVEAGAGNDLVWGDNGKDTLDGGAGQDQLDGGNGTDTCIAGELLTACEL